MKSELLLLYHYILWVCGRVPYRPVMVWHTFLGRSEVPNSSNKDKKFVSDFSDHVCEFLEDAYSMGRISRQRRDSWYAALGRYLPDLRQRVVPKKDEVREEYMKLHQENVARNGFGATSMITQLRNSIK